VVLLSCVVIVWRRGPGEGTPRGASMARIVIGLDSFFGSILNFPEHYEKFKNDYIYERFLNGTCCTSTDYVFDHKEL